MTESIQANIVPHHPKRFLRYTAGSISSSCLDFMAFALMLRLGSPLFFCFVGSRGVSILYSFVVNKYLVFRTPAHTKQHIRQYSMLVASSMTAAYLLTRFLWKFFLLKQLYAKAIAEISLFFLNFIIQNHCIFLRDQEGKK